MSRQHAALMLACMLTACASTSGNTYYSLNGASATRAVEPAASQDQEAKPVISLAPIRLPVAVDRSQIVLRRDDRVQVLETSRWAQPLKYELSSALVDDLSQMLPGYQVFSGAHALQRQPDIRIGLDVQRFDSERGVAATIEARWEIRDLRGQLAPINGHALVREPVADASLDALANAHTRALRQISKAISQQITR
ncbi:MAG TPA: PqiC family protein [Methylophilaceae bacterium]|nr:PqiC family protein [Methylophilaceae bacterium]